MAARRGLSVTANVLAGLLGGGLFLVLWLLLGVPLVWSLAAGAAGWGAGLLVFRRRPAVEVALDGATREMRLAALREGTDKLADIRRTVSRIADPRVRGKGDAVCTVVQNILEDLRKDPGDIRSARQFLSYYLDATGRIFTRYVELADTGLATADIASSMRRVEQTMDTMRSAFEKQHARLLEHDVLDLDSEIALLENTLRLEGLAEEEKK
jgi:5-bromo-4-chloroindolyl phosphate hydrolysis protein